MPVIGQSIPRVDAYEKVTGKAQYPADIHLPNEAQMKIRFAGRPHAIVRKIDTRQAEALPGVLGVFTARDVPANEYGLIMKDQPVFCGPGSPKPFTDHVRFFGDQVAAVVAESAEIAAQACALIEIDFEDLPVVSDVLQAVKPDAPLIHPERPSNTFESARIRKGDVESAFANAAVVIEGEYRTPIQEHAFLQPESGIAYVDEEGILTVKVAGQFVHEERNQIAHALNLPPEKVRLIHPAIGGAFGGREDISVQIALALAALRLHQRGLPRPVRIVWTREESIIGHHKRHMYILRTRWAADREGNVTAAEYDIIQDAGAYCYTSNKVLKNTTLTCTGSYDIPNVKVDIRAVYTNNIPGGAFRGFGGPQGAFAAEMQMDKLAHALGMDPVEIRWRNLLREGTPASFGFPHPPGVSLPEVVERCANEAGWQKQGGVWHKPDTRLPLPWITKPDKNASPAIRRGIGFACGYKNIGYSFGGPESCFAAIELHGREKIDKVVLRHAAAEVGQGAHTILKQMTAEALGVPIEIIETIYADTGVTDHAGSVSASRMTYMAGNSIRGAAEQALQKWEDEERPAIAQYQYKPAKTTPLDPQNGRSELPNIAYAYMAQAAAVEVDTETGRVDVLDVISVNDVGKAINPQQVDGQIEGAVVQAIGYTILENFIQEGGYTKTQTLSTYLIPGILDIPDQIQRVIMEIPLPGAPWGARGVGEMPYITLAPAVIAAVHDATGVWFDEFPLTPERVLRGLGKIT